MTPKLICFDHNGQNIHAEVVYNFEDFSDVMLVIPPLNIQGINEIILLTRRKQGWTTLSSVKYKFPSTIQSIIECVNEELKSRSFKTKSSF